MSEGAKDGSDRVLGRRDFLIGLPLAAIGAGFLLRRHGPGDRGGAGGVRAAGLGGALGAMKELPDTHPIGVQLYTLRSLLAEDLEGTLASVREIGYREVEFAGLWGRTPGQMRGLLDDLGLRAASSHHGLIEVRNRWEAVLEGAAVLGQKWVVVPSIDGRERTRDGLLAIADEFNAAGEAARAHGLGFGYHNHAWEFEPLPDGTLPYDLLLERTDPELVKFQMDLYWTVHGGADPLQYFGAYPGRFTTVHVKDRTPDGRMVDVGAGSIDFRFIFDRHARAGIQHYFVEHDQPADPLASVRASFQALEAVLAQVGA